MWKNPKTYTNHKQWQSSSAYKTAVSGPHNDLESPDGTDGKGACTVHADCTTGLCQASKCVNLLCEMIKYGEIRSLIAGTTMIQGTLLRKCADTLIRNADLPYHGLPGGDTVRTNILGASTISNADKLREDLASGAVKAYVIHLGEGIDETARKEFDTLEALNLVVPGVVVIHGTALGAPELGKLAKAKIPMIWSPSSNLALYGKTNDIVAIRQLGIRISLAPDWTPSGEPNLLGELKVAAELNRTAFKGALTAKQLVEMVTIEPAGCARLRRSHR